jgi:hypothetical protein
MRSNSAAYLALGCGSFWVVMSLLQGASSVVGYIGAASVGYALAWIIRGRIDANWFIAEISRFRVAIEAEKEESEDPLLRQLEDIWEES